MYKHELAKAYVTHSALRAPPNILGSDQKGHSGSDERFDDQKTTQKTSSKMRTIEITSDSKSKAYQSVEYPIYEEVTDLNEVPFNNDEIQVYTER